jgi:hypothetical protein
MFDSADSFYQYLIRGGRNSMYSPAHLAHVYGFASPSKHSSFAIPTSRRLQRPSFPSGGSSVSQVGGDGGKVGGEGASSGSAASLGKGGKGRGKGASSSAPSGSGSQPGPSLPSGGGSVSQVGGDGGKVGGEGGSSGSAASSGKGGKGGGHGASSSAQSQGGCISVKKESAPSAYVGSETWASAMGIGRVIHIDQASLSTKPALEIKIETTSSGSSAIPARPASQEVY